MPAPAAAAAEGDDDADDGPAADEYSPRAKAALVEGVAAQLPDSESSTAQTLPTEARRRASVQRV